MDQKFLILRLGKDQKRIVNVTRKILILLLRSGISGPFVEA